MFSEQQKQIMMVSVFLAVFLCAGIWYYQMMWGKQLVATLDKESESLDKDIKDLEKKKVDYLDLQSKRSEMMAMAAQVEKAAQRLPRNAPENQIQQILIDIMKETSVYPIRVAKEAPITRDVYTETPYKIECFVKYHNLGEMFNLIEENPQRFMRIKQFKIDNESAVLKDRPSVQYATVEVSTYTFNPRPEKKNEPAAEAAAPVGKPAPAKAASSKGADRTIGE